MFKSLTVLGVSILSVVALVGCSESEIEKVDSKPSEKTEQAEETQAEPQQEEKQEVKAPEIFQVGDAVNFDDLTITVNSVRESTGTNEYDKPEKDKYLVLDITVQNNGSESYALSSMMNFVLLDADGRTQEQSIMLDTNGQLDGEIGAGRKLRGEIVYDVANSDKYELIFEELITSGQAIWEIKN